MRIFLLSLITLLSSCTSIDVREIDASHNIKHLCIKDNPRVIVEDFISTVEDVFNEHSITTEIYHGKLPEHCEYKLFYTALRSWDIAPYLSHAELRLYKGSERVGYAEYHHNGGSISLALNKWASVESKMTPIVHDLLAQY